MCKLSVVMSVFNGSAFLNESIDSILNQTFPDFEFIIIDDGSTDDSALKIKSYSDKRIIFIQNEKNFGLSRSLNKGISISRGEYIARMDCDDVSLPTRFEKQIKYLDQDKSLGLIGSWTKVLGTDILNEFPLKHEQILNQLLFSNCISHPTVMFRKSFFLEYNLNYNALFKYAQDYELWVRCIKLFKIMNIPDILLFYREHKQQMRVTFNDLVSFEPAKIKVTQLAEFSNLSFNDAKIQLCFSVFLGKFSFTISDFCLLDEFLKEQLMQNSYKKYYFNEVFYKYLFNIWFSAFIRIELYNFKIYKVIRHLYFYSNLNFRKKKLFLLKCIINYKK